MAISRLSVKVGKTGKAQPHAAYIARQGQYADRLERGEKLEAADHGNLPSWAQHDPLLFWKAADLYERSNGSTYREHELALPRELNPAQRLALVQDWIKQELGDSHTYQFAIHTPRASDGREQPHCHLMFCERKLDGIARDPEQFFKRYNSKNPERGGARKANTGLKFSERQTALSAQRHRWEVLANEHLKSAGHDVSIDMRSYANQGVDKTPERKLLPSQWHNPTIKNNLITLRQIRQEQSEQQAALVQQIPDLKTAIVQQQEAAKYRELLQPRRIEKLFLEELAGVEKAQEEKLKSLQANVDYWSRTQSDHLGQRPEKGLFGRLSYPKRLADWEQKQDHIIESKVALEMEMIQVKRTDTQAQAEAEFRRKHPVLAEEKHRLALEQQQQEEAQQQARELEHRKKEIAEEFERRKKEIAEREERRKQREQQRIRQRNKGQNFER